MKSYVPVASVTITPPHTEMILSGEAFPGVEIKDASYTTMTLSDYMVVTDKVGDTVTDGYGTYTSTLEWSVADTNALTIDPSTGKITTGTSANTSNKVTVKANDRGTKTEVGSVTMNVLKADILCNGTPVTGGNGSIPSITLVWNDPSTLSLKFINDYFDEGEFENSHLKNDWCIDGTVGDYSRYSFDIESNGFTATVRRRANAENYIITAVIQEKNTNAQIVVLSFNATN